MAKKKGIGKTADGRTIVATNRRASFQYEVIETFEGGLALVGPEVKSLRDGKASLSEAYGFVRRGEVFLAQLHIPHYLPATRSNVDPVRERKVLLHRSQIAKLESRLSEQGLTLVPMSLYFNVAGRAKVELALVRGKRMHDKRETIKRREADREAQRSMRRGSSRR